MEMKEIRIIENVKNNIKYDERKGKKRKERKRKQKRRKYKMKENKRT